MGTKPLAEGHMPWLGEASDEELALATEFLSLTVKALADLLVHDDALEGWAARATKHLELAADKKRKKQKRTPDEGSEQVDDQETQAQLVNGNGQNRSLVEELEGILSPSLVLSTDSSLVENKDESVDRTSKGEASKAKTRVPILLRKLRHLGGVQKKFTAEKHVSVPVKAVNIESNAAKILKVDLGKYFCTEEEKK